MTTPEWTADEFVRVLHELARACYAHDRHALHVIAAAFHAAERARPRGRRRDGRDPKEVQRERNALYWKANRESLLEKKRRQRAEKRKRDP